MNKRLKAIPKFASEAEERAFWESPGNDSSSYFDSSNSVRAVFPNLKTTTTSISLRLPDALLAHIKAMANKLDVPYQSLMKLWLAEKLDETEKRAVPAKRLTVR
ncbi:MAG: BrnA antitoxin family protein [Thiobacillus sp.]|nr:BrnA antitoxin family protein [Thiobacillus sp.]